MAKQRLKDITSVRKERLLTIGNITKPYNYDIPKGFVEDMLSAFNPVQVADEMKNSIEREKDLSELGKKVSDEVISLENRYRDRTAEVIDEVAKKTGIYFPHVFQRYLELFYLGAFSGSRYDVLSSNTRELKTRVNACSFKKLLEHAGIKDAPCRVFCKSAIQNISAYLNIKMRCSVKAEPNDKTCTHHFVSGE